MRRRARYPDDRAVDGGESHERWHPATAAAAAGSVALSVAVPWCCGFPLVAPLLAAGSAGALAALTRPGGLAAWGRIVAAAWIPLAVSSLLVHGVFSQGATTTIASVGPLELTAEGLAIGWTYAGRLLILVAAGALFAVAVTAQDVLAAIESRRWPADLALALQVALNTVPFARRRAEAIRDAQRARGLRTEGGLARRVASAPALVVPLALGLLVDGETRARALELRGARIPGSGPRIRLHALPDSPRQKLARRVLPLISIAAVLVAHVLGA